MLLVVFPLCLPRKIGALGRTSEAAVGIVSFVVIVICVRSIANISANKVCAVQASFHHMLYVLSATVERRTLVQVQHWHVPFCWDY